MIKAILAVIEYLVIVLYHCMSIGDIYIPNTKLLPKVEGIPVGQYYNGGQANTSMNSANHTAMQQIFDFYWGLNPYLHMVEPATQFARTITGWCADFMYGVDTFLQTLYVNLFSLMDIRSTFPPNSTFWNILHWGESLGIFACILATVIYFGLIIIAPKGDVFEKLRILIQQIIIGTAVISIFPVVANGFTVGLEYAANVLIGNGQGAGGSGKTMGSMTNDIFRYNIISVPHKVASFGLNPNGTPVNSNSSSSGGSDGSSGSQGTQQNDSANNPANVIHVPESNNRIRYRPHSTFWSPSQDNTQGGSNDNQEIYAHEIMINLNAMTASEANEWNGLWYEGIPSFLHEYESDDSILDPQENDQKRDAYLKGKSQSINGTLQDDANSSTDRAKNIQKCVDKGKSLLGCKIVNPKTEFGAKIREGLNDYGEGFNKKDKPGNRNGYSNLEGQADGLHNITTGKPDTITPSKMINDLTIQAHAATKPSSSSNSKGSNNKQSPAKDKSNSNSSSSSSANSGSTSEGIFGYDLDGDDDFATISKIQGSNNFFKKAAVGSATTSFYDKYKVQWFDIFTALLLLAFVFIAFIAKLIGAFFKVSVMYASLGMFIYKAVSAPQAWKVFIRSFFGIYEMLLMDLVTIRLWFIIYMITNNTIDNIVFHAVGADANGAVAGLVQFFADTVTAMMAVKGVDAIDRILGPGANAGASNGWGRALTGISLLRSGAGAIRGGYHLGRGVARIGGKGAHAVGKGAGAIGKGTLRAGRDIAGHGGIHPKPKHKAPGPLGRVHQKLHNLATRKNSAYTTDVNGNRVPKKHISGSADQDKKKDAFGNPIDKHSKATPNHSNNNSKNALSNADNNATPDNSIDTNNSDSGLDSDSDLDDEDSDQPDNTDSDPTDDPDFNASGDGLADNSTADQYGNQNGLQAEAEKYGKHNTGDGVDSYTLGGQNNGNKRMTEFKPHRNSNAGNNLSNSAANHVKNKPNHSRNNNGNHKGHHNLSNGAKTTTNSADENKPVSPNHLASTHDNIGNTTGSQPQNNALGNSGHGVASGTGSNPSAPVSPTNSKSNNTPKHRHSIVSADQAVNNSTNGSSNSGNNAQQKGVNRVDRNINRHLNGTHHINNSGTNPTGNNANVIHNHIRNHVNGHNISDNENSNTGTGNNTTTETTDTTGTSHFNNSVNTASSNPTSDTINGTNGITPNANTTTQYLGNLANQTANNESIPQNHHRTINRNLSTQSSTNTQSSNNGNSQPNNTTTTYNLNQNNNITHNNRISNINSGNSGTNHTVINRHIHNNINGNNIETGTTTGNTGSNPTTEVNTTNDTTNNLNDSELHNVFNQNFNNSSNGNTGNISNVNDTNDIGNSSNDGGLTDGLFRGLGGDNTTSQDAKLSDLTNNNGNQPDFTKMYHEEKNKDNNNPSTTH